MIRLMKITFAMTVSFVLSGCSAAHVSPKPFKVVNPSICGIDQKKSAIPNNFNLKPLLSEMVIPLCQAIDTEVIDESITVLDGVDLHTLKGSNFGISLGDQTRDRIVNLCGASVKKIPLSKYFKYANDGLTALTPDIKEVNRVNFQAYYVVIPTYENINAGARVKLELVDLYEQASITSQSRTVTWQCLSNGTDRRIQFFNSY